jgi:hypothetical protein
MIIASEFQRKRLEQMPPKGAVLHLRGFLISTVNMNDEDFTRIVSDRTGNVLHLYGDINEEEAVEIAEMVCF